MAVVTTIAHRPEPSSKRASSIPLFRRPAVRGGRFSIYATHYSGEDVLRYVRGAVALSASLDTMGSRVDRIAITAYLTGTQHTKLRDGGWCVLDASERRLHNTTFGIDMRRFYRPLYSQEQASPLQNAHKCTLGSRTLRPPCPVSQAGRERRPGPSALLQARKDGAGTYYKFLAWALTKYTRLLHVDADTVLLEAPDRHLMQHPPYFAAPYFTPSVARDGRSYDGFCSCLMILTPDSDIFSQILAKAASGSYLAFTNTDQDVLESMFTPSAAVGALPRSKHHPPHEARRVAHQAASKQRQHACRMKISDAELQSKIEAGTLGLPRHADPYGEQRTRT